MTSTLFLFLFFSGAPDAGARVQMGAQSASYRITVPSANLLFPGYANNGYRQRVRHENATTYLDVNVKNRQLSSKVNGRTVDSLPPRLAQLQRRLNQEAGGTQADQVMALFTWLRQEIQYDLTVGEDQALSAVLAHRRANCVGMSNLALFVLREMGIRARYVTGLALRPEDRVAVSLEGDVLHRWIEVHYDDVGWVFCDPAGKVNFVEATYVVLGVEDVHPLPKLLEQAVGAHVELLSFKNGLRTIARFPDADSRLRVRPNRLFTVGN